MNTFAAWLTIITYLAFVIPLWRELLSRLSKRLGDWSVGLFLIPFLLASELTPDWQDIAHMALYVALPTLLLRLRKADAKPMDIFHVLVILSIWVPVEPDLFLLPDAVELPGVSATLVPGVELPIGLLTGVLLALYLFTIHHPLKDLPFTFRLGKKDILEAFNALTAYTIIGIPIGLGMRFLVFELDLPSSVGDGVLILLAGYLLTAVPEEILFRGIFQNLLNKRIENSRIALPLTSIIFGLAHLNNATPRYPEPNWGYVIMATLAGLAYGYVYHRTKKVTASAVTHALVNFVWGIVFSG
jgi:membrane protease YdiL (CAAX protease family)